MTALRAEHADGHTNMGVDGVKGLVADMTELKVWDPYVVKAQTYKTAIESACMLLRIDDIVSGMSSGKKEGGGGGGGHDDESFGDERDG